MMLNLIQVRNLKFRAWITFSMI